MHFSDQAALFLQVLVVVGLPLLLWLIPRVGKLFPLPIIQIFVGIALGPTLLGNLAPQTFDFLFHDRFAINTLATVASVLFVFLAGCEVDRQIVRQSKGMVLGIGISGTITPFVLGAAGAWFLLTTLPGAGLTGKNDNAIFYAIAFGICMAVTALPVLMIVLREIGFNQKPIGSVALAIGGLDDAFLWISIAIILPFADAGKGSLGFLWAFAGAAVVAALLIYVVSPILERLMRNEAPERLVISLVIITLFLSAMITDVSNLHAVLGAFLTGLLLPEKLRHLAPGKLEVPVHLLLLPFLFLQTGLNTRFEFNDPVIWTVLGTAFLTCIVGKFLGVSVPAYLSGQSLPFSVTLGALMQCKGLMEIVIVTVLAQKGLFGPPTFSALILTALISTAITAPAARACERFFGSRATDVTAAPQPSVTIAAEPAPATAAASPAIEGAQLVFDQGIGIVPLQKSEVTIGRHRDDDVRINDLRVSRHHARLKALDDGHFEIANLTADRAEPVQMRVNGADKETAIIGDGDEVNLNGVTFTLRAPHAAHGTPAAA
jgi:K+:H+ antiporter